MSQELHVASWCIYIYIYVRNDVYIHIGVYIYIYMAKYKPQTYDMAAPESPMHLLYNYLECSLWVRSLCWVHSEAYVCTQTPRVLCGVPVVACWL